MLTSPGVALVAASRSPHHPRLRTDRDSAGSSAGRLQPAVAALVVRTGPDRLAPPQQQRTRVEHETGCSPELPADGLSAP
jgi:hypothetical protein